MSWKLQDLLSLAFLIAAIPFVQLPDDPVLAGLFVLGVVWVESTSFLIGSHYRFSPSAPLLLAACLAPSLGVVPVLLAVIFASIAERASGGLGQRLSVALAVPVGVLLIQLERVPFLVSCVAVALVYVSVRLLVEARLERPVSAEERRLWRQLSLKIRPLEGTLAVAIIPFAYLLLQSPWTALLLFPLLRSLRAAAENMVLIAKAFQTAREARRREMKTAHELNKTKRDKELLENFARHLSSQPTLLEVSQSLVATVQSLVQAPNIIVFMSDPPEPFYYQVSEELLPVIQANTLLGLSEPAVLEAAKEKRLVLNRGDIGGDRLLTNNPIVTAIPLGDQGVLCIGSEAPPAPAVLKQLEWLSAKAALAAESAYKQHVERLKKRRAEQKAEALAERVEHMSALVRGAERLASSLDPGEITERFLDIVKESLPQDGGLYLAQQESISWGHSIILPESLREEVVKRQQALLISDVSSLQKVSETPIASLIVAPVSSSGAILALAGKTESYTPRQRDKLFILASQAAMAWANAELYQDVVEARQELEESQARLIQSSKMTAMGQLSAGMAHELNSPIGAVSICLDEAKELLHTDLVLAERLLDKGQGALERARVIIDRLLAYCRVGEVSFASVELKELVQDTVDFLSYQLKSVKVSVGELPSLTLQADYRALQQVLTNLLTNSVHALEGRDSPEVSITTEISESQLIVKVKDNGRGIAEDDLDRIFDPFFTTKETGDGTGLGLWASHQIVERHGGDITVQTKEGEGSTFSIRLPLS